MQRLVGPFPYEKLAHVESATKFGGMENASAIFYADRPYLERRMGEGVVRHETAHQWFGDAVTERDWHHLWLSEGFADRKSTRLNSSHGYISYAVFCLKKKKNK